MNNTYKAKQQSHCINCRKNIDTEEYIEDKYHNKWCRECAKDHLERCDKCHQLYEKDNLETTEDGHQYCEECVTYCVNCEKPISLNDAIDGITDGEHDTWCKDCATKHLLYCDGCEQYYSKKNIVSLNRHHYCNSCIKIALDAIDASNGLCKPQND